jgi:hypothetical protein
MRCFNVFLLWIFALNHSQAQIANRHLFRVPENDRIGFINSAGEIIVKPIFLEAGEFSEGLASARINGSYGYIDETGQFIIPAQFDYALPFHEGLAIVYEKGNPTVIDRQGQKPFDVSFAAIERFDHGKAKVKTRTNKFGLIDKRGHLIIDTVFAGIGPFIEGMAVVYGLSHLPDSKGKHRSKTNEVGVIDSLGRFTVSYGKYKEINNFKNGYFKVIIPTASLDSASGDSEITGFIDLAGKLVMAKKSENNCWITDDVYCGLVKMSLYKYWLPERDGTSFTTEKMYDGFIDLKGEMVINDTTYLGAESFSDNRAFVKHASGYYSVIDTKGNVIAKETFENIVGNGFRNGLAIVKKDGKYGIIDTTANFIVKPQFEDVDRTGILDDYFFFSNGNRDERYGIAKVDGRILLSPVMQGFDRVGFQQGMLRCQVDHKLTYINKNGKIIWQESNPVLNSQNHRKMNIDYMNRGYFYAYSRQRAKNRNEDTPLRNVPKRISNQKNFAPKNLTISVYPEAKGSFFDQYDGITVTVANATNHKVDFNAQDGRLYMKVQAKNPAGEWKDIEYLPSSWCGNSYHMLTLNAHHYWTFQTPLYEGEFKTKLRIELRYIDPSDKSPDWQKKEITMYSNEYDGSINPGQFWRKQTYYSGGIMDPYND